MDFWHILAIILFTINVITGLYYHGDNIKISFWGRIFSTALWNVILYYGGFW